MNCNEPALLMRIFISSTDKYKEFLLDEYLVFEAKSHGLAGATVLRGELGYGAGSVIHSYKFWEVSEKVPTVVELIDEADKIRSFYESIKPVLCQMRYGCLVATEEIHVLMYKTGQKRI